MNNMHTQPFADRPPSQLELKRLILMMSTFQDGSGQMVSKVPGVYFPDGWAFQRCVAELLGVTPTPTYERGVFDVIAPHHISNNKYFGISCKMKQGLKDALSSSNTRLAGRVYIELSNAASSLNNAITLSTSALLESDPDYLNHVAGCALVNQVSTWHLEESIRKNISLNHSCYISLIWDINPLRFKMYQFPLNLIDPAKLSWISQGGKLSGYDSSGPVYDFYSKSGGQLKYYPPVSFATWQSDVFELQDMTGRPPITVSRKARDYFGDAWGE